MEYIIIEDEQHNAELLKSMVEKTTDQAHMLAVLPTVQDSVDWLVSHRQPDVIFMDIRLADGLSFEIFKRADVRAPVIFTTAYDEYALQAFKVYGAAYLLKPIVREELEEALEKATRTTRPQFSGDDADAILEMLKTRQKTYRNRFLLHYRETYKIIPTEEIDYIFLENKIVYFVLLDGSSVAVPYTLDELEEQLDPQFFFRVNRQYILHVNSIESIHKYFGEKAKIILKRNRDAEVIISRIRMPQFKLWLDR